MNHLQTRFASIERCAKSYYINPIILNAINLWRKSTYRLITKAQLDPTAPDDEYKTAAAILQALATDGRCGLGYRTTCFRGMVTNSDAWLNVGAVVRSTSLFAVTPSKIGAINYSRRIGDRRHEKYRVLFEFDIPARYPLAVIKLNIDSDMSEAVEWPMQATEYEQVKHEPNWRYLDNCEFLIAADTAWIVRATRQVHDMFAADDGPLHIVNLSIITSPSRLY